MRNVQTDIEQADQRFHRIFLKTNLIWSGLTAATLTLTSYFVLTSRPDYLHDWHIFAIILLVLATIGVYLVGIQHRRIFKYHDWPPPLRSALISWLGIYICVLLLSAIHAAYSWCFFIALGLGFAVFSARHVIWAAIVTYISLCAFQGYFSLPMNGDKLGGLFGLGMSFLSLTVVCLLLQHLIGERFEKNRLVQQLTQTNAELEEAHAKLAESAAQEQELAVLRERTRLAREMHDTLGHALVLISVKLEAIQRLRERDAERCDREIESTKEIVRESMKELRASIANLRSPALEREPACRAISRYAREMAQRAGLRVTYDLQPEIEGLPEQVEETLWKVGQEALTNIEKHAQAQNVILHISRRDDGHIFMRIQDDGVGLPQELYEMHTDGNIPCTSPEGHYGLSGMRERVESLGGRIYLRPAEQHGTILEVELPLVEAPMQREISVPDSV
ncbi:MAG TPA: sensor histidine kinase [Ktedonobacteraceae bacterium]|jgi:signal transduction histidine kinase|nr:sensor histidine kinase [Ktedonobacteraceae bacterium]